MEEAAKYQLTANLNQVYVPEATGAEEFTVIISFRGQVLTLKVRAIRAQPRSRASRECKLCELRT